MVMCSLVHEPGVFGVYASNGTGTLQITRLGYYGQSYELLIESSVFRVFTSNGRHCLGLHLSKYADYVWTSAEA